MPYLSVSGDRGPGFRVSVGGHDLVVDSPPEAGGHGTGPTPSELFVASLAACAAETASSFLAARGREGQLLEVGCHYELEEAPLRVGSIQLTVHLREELPPDLSSALMRAIYRCSVHTSIAMPAQLTIALARAS
jgi:putative redox protein